MGVLFYCYKREVDGWQKNGVNSSIIQRHGSGVEEVI